MRRRVPHPSLFSSEGWDTSNLKLPVLRSPLLQFDAESDPPENILFRHALVRRNGCEDRVQRANPKGVMFRNGNALRAGLTGLKDDMAANLMHLPVLPAAAEVLHQLLTAQIARQLHATANTSSRTRRKRIESGGAESK